MDKLVSVIIPVYNSEKYLHKCIESVIHQTYRKLEIIIIDDGSTDKSAEICGEYAKTDKRIKLIKQKNKGVSVARNVGMNNATGQYICFVDSDDYVADEYISRMLKDLEQSDADLSVCTLASETAPGVWKKKIIEPDGAIDREGGLISLFSRCGMFGGPVCKLYKTNILSEFGICFNEHIKMCEDNLFCYEYIRCCKRIWCSSDVLYFYCYNPNSASIRSYTPHSLDDPCLLYRAYSEMERSIKGESESVYKYYLTIRAEKWIRQVYNYNLFKLLDSEDTRYIRQCIVEAYRYGIVKELRMKKGNYIMGKIMIFSPLLTKWLCAIIRRLDGKRR